MSHAVETQAPEAAPLPGPLTNERLYAAVKVRRACRTFDGAPLRPEHVALIDGYLDDAERMKGPLGGRFRVVFLNNVDADREIGTYGYTKGFRGVLVAIARPEPLALFQLAYVLHGLVLTLTDAGVGTVWMGGAFNPADILRATRVEDGEIIAAIVPVGYASDHKRLFAMAAPLVLGASRRKPMDFFYSWGDFGTPLGEHETPFRAALELARFAPSAKNKQSWRVVLTPGDERLHIYASFSLRDEVGTGRKQYACSPEYLDVGTFYRSLEVTLGHDGFRGSLVVDDPGLALPAGADMEYLATWVR